MANDRIKISQLTPKGANLDATDLLEISEFNGSGYVTKSITGQEIIDAAAGGGVTNITVNAPLSTSGGTTPDLAISEADASTDGFITAIDWNTFNDKQDELISGTNIKTINGSSVLGSGDLVVSGGGGALKFSSLQVVNGTSVTNSTTETVTYSVLVPANTFSSTAFFDVTTRFTKTGSLSGWSARIYKNTSNSLTGATLIATLGNPFTASNTYTQNARFFRVSSSIIRYYQANFAGITDNISNNVNEGGTTFNLAVDNYFLVTIQMGAITVDTIRGVFCKVLGYE